MCGITGMAGNLLPLHERVLKNLLIFDSVRGEDSTGIAHIGKWMGAEVSVAKQLGNPWQLFEHRSYEEAMKGSARAIIGHNRYATSGGVTRATAHPFENDMLVGVHNGTLKNKHELEDGNRFKVDSEALYHHIEIRGLDHAIQTAEGAWSLVWWDKEDLSLNFLRNNERPMYIASTADKNGNSDNEVLFWASEEWMLEQALWRANIHYCPIFETPVDTHISLPIGDGGKIGKPIIRKMPEKVAKVLPSQPRVVKPVVLDAGGRVLDITKKEQEVKKEVGASVATYDRGYLRAKNRSFELLFERVEGSVDYIVCSDPDHPYKEIRLYPSTKDLVWDHIGHWITGDIKGCASNPSTPSKTYYLIDATTFKIVESEPEALFGPTKATCTETVFNAMGLTCNWCASPLIFGENNKFTKAKECYCAVCAEQSDVTSMVNFTN